MPGQDSSDQRAGWSRCAASQSHQQWPLSQRRHELNGDGRGERPVRGFDGVSENVTNPIILLEKFHRTGNRRGLKVEVLNQFPRSLIQESSRKLNQKAK
jgi:hypothetical protein